MKRYSRDDSLWKNYYRVRKHGRLPRLIVRWSRHCSVVVGPSTFRVPIKDYVVNTACCFAVTLSDEGQLGVGQLDFVCVLLTDYSAIRQGDAG